MQSRQTVINVVANLSGNAVGILAGILTVPHLVSRMGVATYGTWTLVTVLTTLLSMFDLGVKGAVARLIAMDRNQPDGRPADVVMSTGLGIMLGAGALVCCLTFSLPQLFLALFTVPEPLVPDVSLALVLSGLNVAVALPGLIFGCHLWGHERFDLLNLVDVPVNLLKTAAILVLVGSGTSMAQLAAIVLAFGILGCLSRMIVCFWFDPGLRLRPGLFCVDTLKQIYGYGLWYFLLSAGRNILPQIGSAVIGNRMGGAPVAQFAVGNQLAGYVNALANDATQVLAPRAVAHHAAAAADKELGLFIVGGRFATALSLFLAGGVFCLGMPFIHLWQRGLLDDGYLPLMILTAGEVLPMSQWLTYSMILAKSRHSRLALLSVAEGAAILISAIALVGPYGVVGVCAGIAISGAVFRGVLKWLYGCQLLAVPAWSYCTQVFIPVSVLAAVPIAITTWLVGRCQPASWLEIVCFGMLYTAMTAAVFAPYLLGSSREVRRPESGHPSFGAKGGS